jgi:hypothetical protein
MDDEEHLDVCEWTPLSCVLCALPIAACLMQVRAIHRFSNATV